MVHSEVSAGMVRDPLGIPKSPSFHSGLDLAASASAVAGGRVNGSGGGAGVAIPPPGPPGRDSTDDESLFGINCPNGLNGLNGLNSAAVLAARPLPSLLGM